MFLVCRRLGILLAERLLESVPPDSSIFEAQMAVAAGRAGEMDTGVVEGIPGAEGLRQVRESIACGSSP